jgi:glycosyltransferase involved in cell wall biosynthesis
MSLPPNKSLRVLLVSFVENTRSTGMGKWTHCIADELKELGHQPTTWFANDFPLLKRIGRAHALLFPVALTVRILSRRADFDVVVLHEPSGFWYGLMRRMNFGLPPMVVMCHNVESKHLEEMLEFASVGVAVSPPGTRWKAPVFRMWQSDGSIKFADHVICLSSIDREYLESRLRIPPDQITCMVNGVRAWGFPTPRKLDGRRVLFVGGWLEVKGRRLLPTLWTKIREIAPGATLTIIGSGQPAEKVVADFIPEDRSSVRVIPRLTDEAELMDEYSRHDLFLMPSLSEGSPLALLEAMAAGLPVVATRVGGIPDIISHQVNGLLFAPLDCAEGAAHVRRIFQEPLTAAGIGEAARQRAEKLSWRESCKTFLSALDKVMTYSPRTGVRKVSSRSMALKRVDD